LKDSKFNTGATQQRTWPNSRNVNDGIAAPEAGHGDQAVIGEKVKGQKGKGDVTSRISSLVFRFVLSPQLPLATSEEEKTILLEKENQISRH
jgi:hypothetical protein